MSIENSFEPYICFWYTLDTFDMRPIKLDPVDNNGYFIQEFSFHSLKLDDAHMRPRTGSSIVQAITVHAIIWTNHGLLFI